MRGKSLAVPGQAKFAAPALSGTCARDGTSDTRALTEYGNAQRLFDAHGDNIRYAYDVKAWLCWRDGAWLWDAGGAKLRCLAAQLPAQIYEEGILHLSEAESFAKWARLSQKRYATTAAVSFLEDFEQVRLPMALVDADLFLIGIDNAKQVLELKTGIVSA